MSNETTITKMSTACAYTIDMEESFYLGDGTGYARCHLYIKNTGTNQVLLMKELRKILSCSLQEVKDITNKISTIVLYDISEGQANEIICNLKSIGVTAVIMDILC
jgi:ribosomal protein L7/L12